ncbi:uncharacterized protein TrAtP1_010470 [Trichoderma atroviride]|uniref:uncharacterized protein n=1 Tax=Hypocrea atroviridis TaxID=63577 RepID=UPI0033264234|nr:hypothetical protein TrAtP1_010470 [Trichoderma atroviride]
MMPTSRWRILAQNGKRNELKHQHQHPLQDAVPTPYSVGHTIAEYSNGITSKK